MSDRMKIQHAICALSDAGSSNNDIVRMLKVAKTTVIRTLKKLNNGRLKHDVTSRQRTVLTPSVRRAATKDKGRPHQVDKESGKGGRP